MRIFQTPEKALNYIEGSSDRMLTCIDQFWKLATEKGWFENKELMNAVMFMEHEISRPCSMNKVAVAELRDVLPIND